MAVLYNVAPACMATGGDPAFLSGDDMQTESSTTTRPSDHRDHGSERMPKVEKNRDFPDIKGAPSLYQASDCFAAHMSDMISDEDLHTILEFQEKSLSNFEKANEKFKKFNGLSAAKYESVQQHFKSHTKVLIDMKKDLETVFRRIRTLKAKLNKAFPTAFIATSENIKQLEEEFAAGGILEDTENTEELISTAERKLCIGDVVHAPRDKADVATTGLSQTETQMTNSTTTAAVQVTTMQAVTVTTSTLGMTSNARDTATEETADCMTAGVEREQKE